MPKKKKKKAKPQKESAANADVAALQKKGVAYLKEELARRGQPGKRGATHELAVQLAALIAEQDAAEAARQAMRERWERWERLAPTTETYAADLEERGAELGSAMEALESLNLVDYDEARILIKSGKLSADQEAVITTFIALIGEDREQLVQPTVGEGNAFAMRMAVGGAPPIDSSERSRERVAAAASSMCSLEATLRLMESGESFWAAYAHYCWSVIAVAKLQQGNEPKPEPAPEPELGQKTEASPSCAEADRGPTLSRTTSLLDGQGQHPRDTGTEPRRPTVQQLRSRSSSGPLADELEQEERNPGGAA